MVVADAEPVFALGLAALLRQAGLEVAQVPLAELLSGDQRADVVVLDARLGREWYAGDVVAALAAADPRPAVVVVADRVRPAGLAEVLEAGAGAVVHRQGAPEEFGTAALAVLRGQTWLSAPLAQVLRDEVAESSPARQGQALTPRELDVLRALASGGSNAAIGARLGISEHTVRNHVHALLGKLGARNRTDALTTAVRRGLVDLAG